MPVQYIKSAHATVKKDAKRHRPIDWFAIIVLISVAFVVIGFLSNKVDEFNIYMKAVVEGIVEGTLGW